MNIKISFLLLIFLCVVVLFPLSKHAVVRAADDNRLEDLQKQLQEAESKLQEAQSKRQTLEGEISYIKQSVYRAELKIEESTEKIKQKEEELQELSGEVEEIKNNLYIVSEALKQQELILQERLRERYKSEKISSFEIFISNAGVSDFVTKLKYLKVAQEQDSKILNKFKDAKENYTSQKVLLEDKKAKVEALKKSIEIERSNTLIYQNELKEQQQAKDWLLAETKNDESNYQKLIQQIRSELDSINSALAGIIGREGTEVKQGDVIAREGNTGCSTGPHLHFGVYKDGVAVNPRNYLGDEIDWPIDDPIITQEYGENRDWYLRYFGIPGHNGIDMTGPSPYYGTPIRAAADGIAYISYDNNACSMTGTVGKGVVIDHGDGLKTIYWHVQ